MLEGLILVGGFLNCAALQKSTITFNNKLIKTIENFLNFFYPQRILESFWESGDIYQNHQYSLLMTEILNLLLLIIKILSTLLLMMFRHKLVFLKDFFKILFENLKSLIEYDYTINLKITNHKAIFKTANLIIRNYGDLKKNYYDRVKLFENGRKEFIIFYKCAHLSKMENFNFNHLSVIFDEKKPKEENVSVVDKMFLSDSVLNEMFLFEKKEKFCLWFEKFNKMRAVSSQKKMKALVEFQKNKEKKELCNNEKIKHFFELEAFLANSFYTDRINLQKKIENFKNFGIA